MSEERSKRRRRPRRILLATLAAAAVGLLALHLFFPLPYVLDLLVHRGPDFDDMHRFPACEIAAPASPSELPVAGDPHVREVLAQHPDVESLEALLDATETSAFLVVHDGRLVEERYRLGHDQASPENTFSIAKTVTSALVGLAIEDGVLALDDPITTHLSELRERDEQFSRITIRHLLDMQSGIRYSSGISFPVVNCDDALIYFYPDLASVALGRTEVESPPGTFEYNNYNPPLLGLILERTTGAGVCAYMERKLWQPLGAEDAAGWTVDDRGFPRMESGFHARARDLARFGMLYLERGEAAGRRVLPESWVITTTGLPEPVELETYNGRAWVYHAGWWLVPRPEGPPDFCAIGHFGQFIYVSPQYETVFVRTGPGRGDWGDYDWTALFYFVAERL